MDIHLEGEGSLILFVNGCKRRAMGIRSGKVTKRRLRRLGWMERVWRLEGVGEEAGGSGRGGWREWAKRLEGASEEAGGSG